MRKESSPMKKLSSLLAIASLSLVCAIPVSHAQSVDFRFGTAIEATQAERSITIGPDTRWANVKHGESIRFVSGQQSFGWKFDGTRSAVDLTRVAPAGFLDRPFMVYVAPTAYGRKAN
jgi:hypothetical protein